MKECLGSNNSPNHVRRRCRECKKIYQKKWRQTENGTRYEKMYQAKIKHSPLYWAKAEVYKAIRRGMLPKASTNKCIDCMDMARIYDHRDYSKPLIVEPVCTSCNSKRGPAL